jgi:plastocyanin
MPRRVSATAGRISETAGRTRPAARVAVCRRAGARARVLSAVVISLGLAAGCSGSSTPSATGTAVSIKSFAFHPQTLTVSVGSTVTWTQRDDSVHTVTASDKAFDSGNLAKGQIYSFTFTTPGTYRYVCSIHTYMHGEVIVR